jgi:hypothetical protein
MGRNADYIADPKSAHNGDLDTVVRAYHPRDSEGLGAHGPLRLLEQGLL